ncbi:hypothetical protein A3A55_02415 [Candidatus Roizmanbacteria bacterium RIFCSPLOWO2_01_FULL_40_14]|nr:MAG: hypothetical protein A3A55_02415 [Candidatus Roizmanbacteria bacterium RIFCSPLOWO2_01_FULL_40_14]
MHFMFRKLLLFLVSLAVLLPVIVTAQTDFSLSFDVSYVFDEHGNALVTKRITLTNLNTNTYPSVYLVDVPNDASNIVAFDENGQLEMKTVQEGGRKMARISLPDQNVGVDQKSNINLSFNTGILAKQESGNWQIVIPPFTADEHVVSYNTSITTPEIWGPPSYVSPTSSEPGKWTISEHSEESIVMMFGELPTSIPETKVIDSPISSTLLIIGVLIGLLVTAILFFVFNKRYNRT